MRKYYVIVGKKVKVINGEKRKKINKKKIKGKAKMIISTRYFTRMQKKGKLAKRLVIRNQG